MKKLTPWILTALFTLWVASSLRPPKQTTEFDLNAFGRLPVLLNGRVQPMDSVARNSLLAIAGRQVVYLEGNGANGAGWGDLGEFAKQENARPLKLRQWYQFSKHPKKLSALQWFAEATMKPKVADERFIFRIHHPEVISDYDLRELGVEKGGMQWFSYNELTNHFDKFMSEAQRIRDAKKEVETWNPYEKQISKVASSLWLYTRIKNSLKPENSTDFGAELAEFEKAMKPGREAAEKFQSGESYSQEDLDRIVAFVGEYERISRVAYPLIIPPANPQTDPDAWSNIGIELTEATRKDELRPEVKAYGELISAYRANDAQRFNTAVQAFTEQLAAAVPTALGKGQNEYRFNHFAPFSKSTRIYLFAFVLACLSWLNMSDTFRRSAFNLIVLGFVIHTAGLAIRMLLEGRPPVTNLYSSAVFVGWGGVILGIVLERFYKDGIGSVTAAAVGFITLLVAHYLSLDGDTMEMLRAVLDTNAWLATHVVIINLGYSATYIAGFLAIVYILRGVFTRSLHKTTADSLTRMVYGIVCFATLFSFVGTVLGGIWADQSWGRFWGWDPKENGALLIVIWNAIILHARWGGLIKQKGLMNMAVFGNVVTTWSYFGVNTLGIGLHSYGFMEGSFRWQLTFNATQIAIIMIGLLPMSAWMSARSGAMKGLTAPKSKEATA